MTTPHRQVAPARRSRLRWVMAGLLATLLAWLAFDLYGPRSSDIRRFDPDEVARLEAAMWRSYYDKQRVRLFNQMTELLRTQYGLPVIRSNAVGYEAARAAFVFKDGRNRSDYEKALPNLVNFYTEINRISEAKFDIERVARLELEWWIIHRERRSHKPGDLERALADLPAALYNVEPGRFTEHARLRAEAMTIRDNEAESGGVSESSWVKIEELLHLSWRSLHTNLNS